MKAALIAGGLLAVAATAGAAEDGPAPLELNGAVGGLAWHSDDPLMARGDGAGAHLQLEARLRAGSLGATVRADAVNQADAADPRGTNRLREAWLRYRGDSADLTVGRQLLPAGRGDVIVLQDQFAPRDLTQIALTESDQQLGVLAARLDAYPTEALTVSAAAIRQDRSYVLPRAIGAALPPWRSLADDPAAAALARVEYRAGSVELAASVGRGASPLPGVTLGAAGPVAVNPDERRWALDGSLSLGKDVLRWDVDGARTASDALPGFTRRRQAGLLGWDRGLWRDADLSVQAIVRHDDLAEPGAAAGPLAALFQANARLAQAFRPTQRFVTATLKQRIGAAHQFDAGLLAGSGRQFALFGRWVWQFRDNFALQAKVQALHGDAQTLVGSLGYQRLAYVELRYQF